jgi:hypothetical protein
VGDGIEGRVDAVAGHAALNHVDTNFWRAGDGGRPSRALPGRNRRGRGAAEEPVVVKGARRRAYRGGGRRPPRWRGQFPAKVGTSGVRVWDGDVAEVVRGRDTLDGGDWCISGIRVSKLPSQRLSAGQENSGVQTPVAAPERRSGLRRMVCRGAPVG